MTDEAKNTRPSPGGGDGLVERLRDLSALEPGWYANVGKRTGEQCCAAMREAAAEIEALRARVGVLETALEPFAKASDKLHSGYDDGIAAGDHPMSHVFVADLRAARQALQQKEAG